MLHAYQPSLLGRTAPCIDTSFSAVRRIELDATAWLDHLPGWVSGHETVFEVLRARTRWQAGQRVMYDNLVDVPRLTARLPADGPGHPLMAVAAVALGRRYGVRFDRWSLALYRDGRDSVAWHRDKVLCDHARALVAIVSLGTPRRFRIRPVGGGPTQTLALGWGDLVVMGGACQRDWEHGVPKVRDAAGPRMSVMFRHSEELR